jgi:hypothetical protein
MHLRCHIESQWAVNYRSKGKGKLDSYVSLDMGYLERQRRLMADYGFECISGLILRVNGR